MYLQPRFAQRLVLSLESPVLDSEFNSLSNGIGYEVGHRRKIRGFSRNTLVFPKSMMYFQPRFGQRLVLSLKSPVLDSEFNSLSNGIAFEVGHQRKIGGFSRNTLVFPKSMKYFQPRFAQELVLSLESLMLDSEFNSLSNGIELEVGHRRKTGSFSRNTLVFPKFMEYFQPRFDQRLVLSLESPVLLSEFNSLSNGIGLEVGHQ